MMSTWNKFCFTGGAFLASVTLPGSPSVAGLWPAVWAMGNLGRAGYGASLDGMWPVRLSVVFSLLVSLTWTRCSVHIRLLRRRHSAKSNNTGRSAHRRYYQRRRSRGRRSILSSGAETLALHLPWGRAPRSHALRRDVRGPRGARDRRYRGAGERAQNDKPGLRR